MQTSLFKAGSICLQLVREVLGIPGWQEEGISVKYDEVLVSLSLCIAERYFLEAFLFYSFLHCHPP